MRSLHSLDTPKKVTKKVDNQMINLLHLLKPHPLLAHSADSNKILDTAGVRNISIKGARDDMRWLLSNYPRTIQDYQDWSVFEGTGFRRIAWAREKETSSNISCSSKSAWRWYLCHHPAGLGGGPLALRPINGSNQGLRRSPLRKWSTQNSGS